MFVLSIRITLSWSKRGGDDNNGILCLIQATCGGTDLGDVTGLLTEGIWPLLVTPVCGESPKAGVVLLESILGSGDVHPCNSADTLSSHAE
jgi:hypothetical protein